MMGMLVTGTSSDILKLSTDDFTLYISGSSENKKFKATNNNKNIMVYIFLFIIRNPFNKFVLLYPKYRNLLIYIY